MELIRKYLTKNPYWQKNQDLTDPRYREYQKHGPQGMMLHSIGCPQPSAMALIKGWDKPNYTRACVHGFIDANTGAVYQTMPFNYRAPHAGGDATDSHIGIEMCEPDCIRYTSGSNFTCSNVPRAQEMVRRTYLAAVELFAQTCAEYGWDPMEDGVIISHREGYERGVASNHGDPEHLWRGLGLNYTMDTFREDVQAKMMKNVNALRPGDKGENVKQLQRVLRLLGHYDGEVDGSYGPRTTDAVKAFQKAIGLNPDGVAGPETLEALRKAKLFTDVPTNAWYADDVTKAAVLGLMEGVGSGNFDPNRAVTRGELAAVAVRLYEILNK